jgi:hypothetical protein
MIAEATHQFVFGYIRFAHFAAAFIMTLGFIGRIYWAFVGNHHAKQLFILPVWNPRWWKEVFFELRWYFFLEKEPKKYVGHNPLAQIAMFFFMTLGITYMIFTGFALYSEGLGAGSWADRMFGWIIPLVGGSQAALAASPGDVDDPRLHHHPHLRRDPRGHHVPPVDGVDDDLRPPDLQGRSSGLTPDGARTTGPTEADRHNKTGPRPRGTRGTDARAMQTARASTFR